MKNLFISFSISLLSSLFSFVQSQPTPPAIFDCVDYMIDANLNDDSRLMVSAYHQTIVKTSIGFYAFGEDLSPSNAAGSKHLRVPTLISEENGFVYTGTPIDASVAADGTHAQGVLLTTDNLFVWGSSGIILNYGDANRGMRTLGLPNGTVGSDFRRVEVSYGNISLISKTNVAYTYSITSGFMYGDASTELDNEWHEVAIPNVKFLKHSKETYFAYTTDGNYYTWGKSKVYLGNGNSAQTDVATPQLMTPPFTDAPKMILIGVAGTYFALNAVTQKNHSMGSNYHGVLGQGVSAATEGASVLNWGIVQKPDNSGDLEGVIYISTSSRSSTSTVTPTAGAITSSRDLYIWGFNDFYILSDKIPRDTNAILPMIPTGFVSGESKAMYVENGGHITPYIDSRYRKFGYVGHCFNGSMGVEDCSNYTTTDNPSALTQYDFRNTPQIDFCAEFPKIIQSILTNPRFITVDVQ